MENCSSPGKNELIESMFKSLNSYTGELQQELEIVNRKLTDQVRIEHGHQTSQEQLQHDLVKLRAAIETNTVKRSILDRNLSERTTISQSFHDRINEKRQEQSILLDQSNLTRANHHRTIAKMAEQCASLTMAFRTNYHAYARADLDEIQKKTETRLKTISDEVVDVESTVVHDREKLTELNATFHRELQELKDLKTSIEIVASKLQMESDELIQSDQLEKQLVDLQTFIDELENWHRRTNYPLDHHH